MSVGRQAALGYTLWPSRRSVAAKGRIRRHPLLSRRVVRERREAAEKVLEQSGSALNPNCILGIADDVLCDPHVRGKYREVILPTMGPAPAGRRAVEHQQRARD